MWISILCRKIDFWASAHTRTVIRQLDLKVPFAGGVYNGQFNEVECNCHHLHSRLAKNGLGIISAITIIEIFAHSRSLHSTFLCKLWFLFRKISVAAFLNFNQLCGIALITIGCVVRVRPPTKIDTKTQKIQILIIKAIFRDNYMTTGNEWFVGVLFRLFFYL